jgi:LysM repeat protein
MPGREYRTKTSQIEQERTPSSANAIMNNDQSNPKNSPFDAKAQPGRSRVKVAVFSVLAVHVAGLTALLLTQGCKREAQPPVEPPPENSLLDSNEMYYTETNVPPDVDSNTSGAYVPPQVDPYAPPGGTLPPVDNVSPPPVGSPSQYVVKSGDSFYTIAKANNTTVRAIEAANPGVDSRRLQIGQKLVLPAPGTGVSAVAPTTPTATIENVYVVKSGDNLTSIASKHKTTVKQLKSLNNLSTDRINVGQKLKLPAPPAPVPVVAPESLAPAPTMPVSSPAPAPAPTH